MVNLRKFADVLTPNDEFTKTLEHFESRQELNFKEENMQEHFFFKS